MTDMEKIQAYSMNEHSHNFAVWTVSRAAFRRFDNDEQNLIELTQRLLNSCSISKEYTVVNLPNPEKFDEIHREWRNQMCELKDDYERAGITHGRAAKIINIYLKSRFLSLEKGVPDAKVVSIHPPIDRILLESLEKSNFAGKAKIWQKFKKFNWTQFDSTKYEEVIFNLKDSMNGQPLWKIEAFWNPTNT